MSLDDPTDPTDPGPGSLDPRFGTDTDQDSDLRLDRGLDLDLDLDLDGEPRTALEIAGGASADNDVRGEHVVTQGGTRTARTSPPPRPIRRA